MQEAWAQEAAQEAAAQNAAPEAAPAATPEANQGTTPPATADSTGSTASPAPAEKTAPQSGVPETWKIVIVPGRDGADYAAGLEIAQKQTELLRSMKFHVECVENPNVSLAACQQQIRDSQAHISLLGGFNTYTQNASANGLTIYVHPSHAGTGSERLADLFSKHLANGTRQRQRGVQKVAFPLCDCEKTGCEASLEVHYAFLHNQEEVDRYVHQSEARMNYAIAVCQAICEYTGVPYTGPAVLSVDALARKSPGAENWKIALVPGHEPNTAGVRSCPFTQDVTHSFRGCTVTVKKGEQYHAYYGERGVSYWQARILEDMGFQVLRMNFKDLSQEGEMVKERTERVRDWGANLCVEVRWNSFGKGKEYNGGKGVVTSIHKNADEVGDSAALAKRVQKQLASVYGQTNRNGGASITTGARMQSCRETGCKATIVMYCGFMTNQQESEEYFCNPEAWFNYAVASCKAICDYTGVKYTGPEMTTKK